MIDIAAFVAGFLNFAVLGFVLFVGAGVIGIGYFSGALVPRKYKIILLEPRGGAALPTICSGSDKKAGGFEVFFGPFQKMAAAAPPGNAIGPGNWIFGYSKQRNDIHWIPWPNIKIDSKNIDMEPALDPGMKIMILSAMKEEVVRYQEYDKLKQYLPLASIVIAAIILILPFIMGVGEFSKNMDKIAVGLDGVASKIHAASNSTIYVSSVNQPPAVQKPVVNIPGVT